MSFHDMQPGSFLPLLAGTFVLVGFAPAQFGNPWWLLVPVFAGANLIQSVFTGFCPPRLVLGKVGWLDTTDTIHWGGRR